MDQAGPAGAPMVPREDNARGSL